LFKEKLTERHFPASMWKFSGQQNDQKIKESLIKGFMFFNSPLPPKIEPEKEVEIAPLSATNSTVKKVTSSKNATLAVQALKEGTSMPQASHSKRNPRSNSQNNKAHETQNKKKEQSDKSKSEKARMKQMLPKIHDKSHDSDEEDDVLLSYRDM